MQRIVSDENEDMTEIYLRYKALTAEVIIYELCRLQPVKEYEIVYEVPHWMTTNSRLDLPDIYYQY